MHLPSRPALPRPLLALLALPLAGLAPQPAAACHPEAYVGSICTTAGRCPRGTLEAAGQLLPIAQNSGLHAVLGTTYGGDGRNTFALPDLRGRSVVGSGSGNEAPAAGTVLHQAAGTPSRLGGARAASLALRQCIVQFGIIPPLD